MLIAGDAALAVAPAQAVGAPARSDLLPVAGALQSDECIPHVERLMRLPRSGSSPMTFDPRSPWHGILFEQGARGTVRITPNGQANATATCFEVTSDVPAYVPTRCWSFFEGLDLAAGAYDVCFQGRECSLTFDRYLEGNWLVASPSDAGEPLVVGKLSSGCMGSRSDLRTFRPTTGGYTADDGAYLTWTDVGALRKRVLSTWQHFGQPGQSLNAIVADPAPYLDALGFDAATIASHLPEIRRACAGEWVDEHGRLVALPESLEPLFEIEFLQRELARHLVMPDNQSTASQSMLIEFPGEPRIVVGTSSVRPDALPWYVAVGPRRWHMLDRELSRSLIDLTPPEWLQRRAFEGAADWRSTLWSDPATWYRIREQFERSMAHESYRLVAGWDAVSERFRPDLWPHAKASRPGLSAMAVDVDAEGPLDRILLRPSPGSGMDWRVVEQAFEACERTIAAQPWLSPWARERGIRVTVGVPLDVDAISASIWRATLPDTQPEFALLFDVEGTLGGQRKRFSVGRGMIARDGTLLITEALPRTGMQEMLGAPLMHHASSEHFVLVEPGRAPVLRLRAN